MSNVRINKLKFECRNKFSIGNRTPTPNHAVISYPVRAAATAHFCIQDK